MDLIPQGIFIPTSAGTPEFHSGFPVLINFLIGAIKKD
jgi:hypothetical protein